MKEPVRSAFAAVAGHPGGRHDTELGPRRAGNPDSPLGTRGSRRSRTTWSHSAAADPSAAKRSRTSCLLRARFRPWTRVQMRVRQKKRALRRRQQLEQEQQQQQQVARRSDRDAAPGDGVLLQLQAPRSPQALANLQDLLTALHSVHHVNPTTTDNTPPVLSSMNRPQANIDSQMCSQVTKKDLKKSSNSSPNSSDEISWESTGSLASNNSGTRFFSTTNFEGPFGIPKSSSGIIQQEENRELLAGNHSNFQTDSGRGETNDVCEETQMLSKPEAVPSEKQHYLPTLPNVYDAAFSRGERSQVPSTHLYHMRTSFIEPIHNVAKSRNDSPEMSEKNICNGKAEISSSNGK